MKPSLIYAGDIYMVIPWSRNLSERRWKWAPVTVI